MPKSAEDRLRDACFTAFMRGKEEHTDWMNDVLPMVDRETAAIREDRAKMVSEKRAPVQGVSAGIPWSMHLRAYDAYCKKYSPQEPLVQGGCRGGFHADELDMLIPGWREELSELAAARSTISEQEKRIAGLEAEREELIAYQRGVREQQSELIDLLKARADAAEQALASERQRREEAEAAARPLADVLNEGLRVGAIGPDSENTDSLYVQLSVLRAAQAYLRKYEPAMLGRDYAAKLEREKGSAP